MIYAIGLGSENTFGHFVAQARARGAPLHVIDLAAVQAGDWRLAIPDDGSSHVVIDGERIALDPAASYYCRVIDLSSALSEQSALQRWRGMVLALSSWLSWAPGQVINRPDYDCHNGTKALHEHMLAKLGFRVPASLTSSDRDRLRRFASEGTAIVKTLSGVRADARIVDPTEFEGFDSRRGPVHLQRFVRGRDVRAHVVGDRVHAELIATSAVDYRRAYAEYRPIDLPESIVRRLVDATRSMGLLFAGWDFKVDDDGELWCLEAKPMPGYDSYDRRLGGLISDSLLDLLGGKVT